MSCTLELLLAAEHVLMGSMIVVQEHVFSVQLIAPHVPQTQVIANPVELWEELATIFQVPVASSAARLDISKILAISSALNVISPVLPVRVH